MLRFCILVLNVVNQWFQGISQPFIISIRILYNQCLINPGLCAAMRKPTGPP
jgi:hypothetical protein